MESRKREFIQNLCIMIEVILGRCIILRSHVSEEDLCGLGDEFHIAEIEASRGCFRVEDLMN